MPDFSGFLEGRFCKKSKSILVRPSIKIFPINIASITSPNKVHAIPKYSNNLSFILFFFELVILFSVFFSYPKTDII